MTFALVVQEQILPKRLLKEIPSCTSYYWKEENSEKYVGVEFAKGIRRIWMIPKYFKTNDYILAEWLFSNLQNYI